MWAPDTVTRKQVLVATFVMATLAIGIETTVYSFNPTHAPRSADQTLAVFEVLHHWDSDWYASIATRGYFFEPGKQSSVAFFPLYPLAIRAVMALGLTPFLAGTLVTLLAAFLAVALFYEWAKRLQNSDAPLATALLLLYPFSIYLFGIVYSDALYLFCAVNAFFALEKNQPFRAAAFGTLGTMCRPIAPALVIGLLVRSLERRGALRHIRLRDLIPALAVSGFLAYLIFLQYQFHDALAWVHVEGAPGWDHTPGWRTWAKLEWFRVMFPRVAPLVAIRLGAHALVTVTALALSLVTIRKLGWGYGLYCLAAIGIPAVSSKDFQGLGRYVIAAFPLFLTVSILLRQRPLASRVVLGSFLFWFVYCAVAWGLGGYVA